jgi:hypothetical protein
MTVGYYRLPNWAYCENGWKTKILPLFCECTLGERSKIQNSIRASNLT